MCANGACTGIQGAERKGTGCGHIKASRGATVVVESSAVAEDIGVPNQVQQSALGSLTDASGEFRLKVPGNLKYVTISYVGYQRIQVPVFQDHRTILLQPSGESLDEVIVTGYTDIKNVKIQQHIIKSM
ncbi:carboxypeptidase-like regulatory domain-containing protein [Sphingobacterium sp. E70]|uniref:carboxypeptidase-like regulatory domain-containing protein n=1 Tax=Sphingobacterium sp. E70 TaxID=2853439 RepID=UPI00211BF357|nr:carboxypeptidase-like regulatory domain-containing protein [Sphingobacterium sp. E70]ULT27126.1 carboxypeptidase-like regulatory domain-containing protein [Sphingobacterium sp. E70]